jgi:hypothetical protein
MRRGFTQHREVQRLVETRLSAGWLRWGMEGVRMGVTFLIVEPVDTEAWRQGVAHVFQEVLRAWAAL